MWPSSIQAKLHIYKHCHKTGRIVEVLPHKQHQVKLNGSNRVTIHNRSYLHQIHHHLSNCIVPSSTTAQQPNSAISEVQFLRTGEPAPASTSPHPTGEPSMSTEISDKPVKSLPTSQSKIPRPAHKSNSNPSTTKRTTTQHIPRALHNLADYNKPRLKE